MAAANNFDVQIKNNRDVWQCEQVVTFSAQSPDELVRKIVVFYNKQKIQFVSFTFNNSYCVQLREKFQNSGYIHYHSKRGCVVEVTKPLLACEFLQEVMGKMSFTAQAKEKITQILNSSLK